MRFVFDTDVIVAAFVSPTGASRALLRMALEREVEIAISTTLFVEYEAVLLRPVHLDAANATAADVVTVLDGLACVAIPVAFDYRWRPSGADADDEFVLETAVNGRAEVVVTFNQRHLQSAAGRFGIRAERPGTILKEIGR